MKHTTVMAAVLVVFAATVVSAAPRANERQNRAYLGMLAMQETEYGEIMQLMRLVPLQLTTDQIGEILAIAHQHVPEVNADLKAELQTLRQRLLRGEQPTASDRKLLRDAMQSQIDDDTAERIRQAIEAIQDVLTEQQLASLLGKRGARAGQNPQKYAASVITPELNSLVDTDTEKAAAGTIEKLIQAIADATDPAIEEAQKQDLREFLQRVAPMTEDQLQTDREELHAELEVLLPDGFDPARFRVAMNPEALNRQIIMTFMTRSARSLLQEMRDAQLPQNQ